MKSKFFGKTNLLLVALVCFAMTFTIFLTGCGDKKDKITEITISANVLELMPGESETISATTNLGNGNGVSLEITSGNDLASISGNTLTISQGATVGSSVSVVGKNGNVTSNTLTFTIISEVLEADAVEITNSETQFFAGQRVKLSANATRTDGKTPTVEVEYFIEEGGDFSHVENGYLYFDNTAGVEGKTEVKVYAKCGEVESDRVTFSVQVLPNILGLKFDTVNFDSSVNNSMEVKAQLVTINGFIDHTDIKYEIISGADVISFENNKITAKKHGTAQIKAIFGQGSSEKTKTATINVLKDPSNIVVKNFGVERFYYAKNVDLVNMDARVDSTNGGCADYSVKIIGNTQILANYNVFSDGTVQNVVSNENISYNEGKLNIKVEGDYVVRFESLSGCQNSLVSREIKIGINDGVNISTKADFANYIENSDYKTINLVSNLVFANGQESFTSYGDKIINGNGYTIDLSGQVLQKGAYDDTVFLTLTSIDYYTSVNTVVRDLTFKGNYGIWNVDKLASIYNTTTSEIENFDNTDFKNSTYKCALEIKNQYHYDNMDFDTSLDYGVVNLDMSNVSVYNFFCGIRLGFVDDKSLTDSTLAPSIRDITLSNIFGDGLIYYGSKLNIGDVNITTVGGTPLGANLAGFSDNAGVNRNEIIKTKVSGIIRCDNSVDGSSLYLKNEIARNDAGKALYSQFNGLSGIIGTYLNYKRTNLKGMLDGQKQAGIITEAEYNKRVANIEEAITNIISNVSGTDYFNLVCFSNIKEGVVDFAEEGSTAVLTDNFILDGKDTTHKYVLLNIYDIAVDAFGGQIGSIASLLEPFKIYLANYNYGK